MLARNRGETCHFAESVMELSTENNSSMALVLALKSVLDVGENGMVTKEAASLYGEDLSARVEYCFPSLRTSYHHFNRLDSRLLLAGNPRSLYVLGLLGQDSSHPIGNDSIWT